MPENLRIPEVNKIVLVGRITRDLELRYTPNNQAVTSFSIAVNRSFKDSQTGDWREITSFVPIVVWARQAEIACDKLKKGSLVYVEGRLQSRSWETKQGEKRSMLEVISERIQFLSKEDTAAKTTEETIQDVAAVKKEEKRADEAWDVEEDISNNSSKEEEEIPF
jgi:single-strand DNA-binding protein